jgi:hypothetical protein
MLIKYLLLGSIFASVEMVFIVCCLFVGASIARARAQRLGAEEGNSRE